ncbi:hypothetical protein L210DRAFT_3322112, partial [Boletus edulis BED1]
MHPVTPVLDALESCQITVADFIVALLTEPGYKTQPMVIDLLANATTIFDAFMQHPATHDVIRNQCFTVAEDTYLWELRDLVSKDSSSHFGAANTTVQQLEEFHIDNMAHTMKSHAPRMWCLFDCLL